MPVGIHIFLMFVTLVVAFFIGGIVGWEWREELQEAGLPHWGVSPFVGLFGAVLFFRLMPARCPGCGWPVAFLRFGEKLMYRCRKCQHVHCTIWGGKSNRMSAGPYRTRARILRFPLDEPGRHRVTFSGHVNRPCTLVLCVRPAPPRGAASELETKIEAHVTNEQGETRARAADLVKDWDSERVHYPWRTVLELRHTDWHDIALPGSGTFALELTVSQVDPKGRSMNVQAALDFLHGAARRA